MLKIPKRERDIGRERGGERRRESERNRETERELKRVRREEEIVVEFFLLFNILKRLTRKGS